MRAMEGLDEIVARLVERVEGRHYGKYRGLVTDNQDPDTLGRLKAKVPRLLADVELGWALPCLPYGGASEEGFFAIPDVGASVWIEFEGGDLAYPIWSGTWWGDGEIPESATPDQKVLKTTSGHKIVFDDSANSIVVTDSNANTVTLDSNGIKVEDDNSNVVTMDSAGVKVEDANGNKVTMDSSGVKVEDSNSNTVTLDSSGIKLQDSSSNSVTMASAGVTIKGSSISIGDPATDNLVAYSMLDSQLQTFVSMVAAHMHVGNLGAPTGPPVPPPTLVLTPAKSHHKLEI
jgi:uncharacterized protein involved in type VI secretion and phage assembly